MGKNCRTIAGVVFVALCGCGLQAQKSELSIRVADACGTEIAQSSLPTGQHSVVRLNLAHAYQPGDKIIVAGPAWLDVQLDSNQKECWLYRQREGAWSFAIPFGTQQTESSGAYDPQAFLGGSHTITVRALRTSELRVYRNLALNACDQNQQPVLTAYPHASASSTYHDMPVFAARNAIDGVAAGGHHGGWPYQSWGPDKVDGLWWRLDFGRAVELDKLCIAVRSDFPHDNYWREAVLEFSDGSEQKIVLSKSAEMQEIRFPRHRTEWIRITHLVPADAPGWCALSEVEAWGREAR